ncbi:ribonuclease HIII [Salisediminibacterium beveridgei]|nr:ribonuclease HIII [Salisediminibacterium beveridgei]
MSHAVLQLSTAEMKKMKTHYQNHLKQPAPQGALFAAKTDRAAITAYKSGKVLFQGKDAEQEAAKWADSSKKAPSQKTKPSSVNKHDYQPPDQLLHKVLIGSDETGTGDFFGPMTVAACHLSIEQLETVESWGIRDSKTVTDKDIRQIAPKLIENCTYSLMTLHNKKYNTLQADGMNQGQMKAMLHHQAITNVLARIESSNASLDGVLIDQFCPPATYFKYLRSGEQSWTAKTPLYFATKAESLHPAVAAASILARYAFIEEMDRIEDKLGMPVPKGAGAKVDQAAQAIADAHGIETLKAITKWHFANAGKVKS